MAGTKLSRLHLWVIEQFRVDNSALWVRNHRIGVGRPLLCHVRIGTIYDELKPVLRLAKSVEETIAMSACWFWILSASEEWQPSADSEVFRCTQPVDNLQVA